MNRRIFFGFVGIKETILEIFLNLNRFWGRVGSDFSYEKFYRKFGSLAQLVEQLPLKQKVPGSNPGRPTIFVVVGFRTCRPSPRWSSHPRFQVCF